MVVGSSHKFKFHSQIKKIRSLEAKENGGLDLGHWINTTFKFDGQIIQLVIGTYSKR